MDAAARTFSNGYIDYATKDLEELIPQLDHRTLVSASRKLYNNVGVVRAILEQKAMYSVGRAFLPSFKGQDQEWGRKAEELLVDWFNHCDIARANDWQTCLYLLSLELDRDGDSWVLLTETENGYPQIQLIAANRIGQKDPSETVVASGTYKGKPITKGIISDKKTGRAIAYRYTDDDGNERDIPAESLIQNIDPQWVGQKRGLPLFSSAINTFRDLKEAQEREQFAQLIMSSLVFAEHNLYGEAMEDDITIPSGGCRSGQPKVQTFEQGQIKYFTANTGSKIEQISNTRPSVEWQQFQDRLKRDACVGVGWSYSLVEGNMDGSGTSNRLAIKQAEKAVEDRQALLMTTARRIITYVVGRFIALKILPYNKEFFRWGFSIPKKISIDVGRDSKALIEEYKMGWHTLEDILGESGKTLEAHIRQLEKEKALLESAGLYIGQISPSK